MNIEVQEDAVEPKEYFKILKDKTKKAEKERLANQLEVIAEQIIAAKSVGQKNFLERLGFCYETIIKEQQLLSRGLSSFVYKEDVKAFLDKVKPKNSIRIIELERYPRAIPLKNLKDIERIKKWELFDDFCVVFTDFTGSSHSTKEEREFVKRNRDPVVFGYFKNKNEQHERFYFVTDWEDEHCDLTFTKMIEKMADAGIKNPEKKISTDHNYILNLVHDQEPGREETKRFWRRVWPSRKK